MDFSQQLKLIRLSKGLSQQEMADILGLKSQQVYGNLENGVTKKVSQDILVYIAENIPAVMQKITTKDDSIINLVQESQAKYEHTSKSVSETPQEKEMNDYKALKSIAESNRILAESRKIAAESGKILAESQRQLVNTNAELVTLYREKTTAGAVLNNHADVQAKLDVLLEAIAETASGKKYHSKQEALATMGKKFYEHSVP